MRNVFLSVFVIFFFVVRKSLVTSIWPNICVTKKIKSKYTRSLNSTSLRINIQRYSKIASASKMLDKKKEERDRGGEREREGEKE